MGAGQTMDDHCLQDHLEKARSEEDAGRPFVPPFQGSPAEVSARDETRAALLRRLPLALLSRPFGTEGLVIPIPIFRLRLTQSRLSL